MAEENEDAVVPSELQPPDEYLPYDLEFLYTASNVYATLIEIDLGLLSKQDQKKIQTAIQQNLQIIVAASNKCHSDYFAE